ncbi:MAG: hypothetical protein WA958_04080 [Tunicatimonas sp.]
MIVSVGGTLPAFAELQLGIRLDLVEQLVYQFTTGLAGYGPHSTTLLVSAGHLQGRPYHRYVLSRPTDVAEVAQAMNIFVTSDAISFFERYSNIAALNELYNATDTRWLPHHLNRSLRGITLAKLAQQPNWPDLVAHYRTQLWQRGTPAVLMDRYEQLATYLRHFSIN